MQKYVFRILENACYAIDVKICKILFFWDFSIIFFYKIDKFMFKIFFDWRVGWDNIYLKFIIFIVIICLDQL